MGQHGANITWEDLLDALYDAIRDGSADKLDLYGVANWPDMDSGETPLQYFGECLLEWPFYTGRIITDSKETA